MAASGIINQRQVDVYADGNWLYPAEDREVMVLHTLTVDPDLSGRGIGRAFAQFYEDCAKAGGLHRPAYRYEREKYRGAASVREPRLSRSGYRAV